MSKPAKRPHTLKTFLVGRTPSTPSCSCENDNTPPDTPIPAWRRAITTIAYIAIGTATIAGILNAAIR